MKTNLFFKEGIYWNLLSFFFLLSFFININHAEGQTAITFSDGTLGKTECWHPVSGATSYPMAVDVETGRCGSGNYHIQWGDGTTTAVRPGQRRYNHTYNLAGFRSNVGAGVQTFNIFLASTDPDCFDLAVVRVTINKIPVPRIIVTAACEDVVSTFTNNSHGRSGQASVTWEWNFSDGESRTTASVTRMFPDPDQEYSVTLTAKSGVCAYEETTDPVSFRLKKLPTTSAQVTGLGEGVLCYTDDSDSTLILDASASTDANRFHWSITGGDYKVDELIKPDSSQMKVKLLESTHYQIAITARNECGLARGENATFSTSFDAMPLPEISLVPQPDGCEELKYQLVNARDGADYFLFRDGVAETLLPEQEVTLTVSEKPYVVEGVIANVCGEKRDEITFFVHPKTPVEITSIPLDTTICRDTEDLPLRVSREGGEWLSENVVTVGGNTVFSPDVEGEFEVTYQVGTGLCLTADTRRIKVIHELPQASIGLDETDLRCSPARVLFSNRSTGADPGYAVWKFMEGEEGIVTSSDTISRVLTATDEETTYTVRLTVRNACAYVDATRNVKILPNTIKPLFKFPSGIFCPDSPVQFEDATVPAPIHWNWDFGDGGKSNVPDPEYSFKAPGVYRVTLEAGNQCATEKVTHNVEIQVPPTPTFTVASELICEGEEISFDNTTDTRYKFAWDFGDGTAADAVNFSPSHTYATAGNYDVKLTIFDGSKECSAEHVLPVRVNAVLQAGFSTEVSDEACEPALVKFVNHTASADTWHWEFSDGTTTRTSNVKEPLIPFTKGQYTFHLTASHEGACPAEASGSAYFDFVQCNVEIPEAFTPNGDLHGDRYTLFGEGIDRIIFLKIRNRWSEVVYEMMDVPPGSQSDGESWDGTKGGKPMPADMYVFEAQVRYRDQTESDVIRGNFYLVR